MQSSPCFAQEHGVQTEKKVFRMRGKKQTLSLKAYFHNNTHEQADFFSAEPQLLQHRSTVLKVLRSSIRCTVS